MATWWLKYFWLLCDVIYPSDIYADSAVYFKKGRSTQDGGLPLCQWGIPAKIQMALIELEVVWKRVVLILCPRFKKDSITSA